MAGSSGFLSELLRSGAAAYGARAAETLVDRLGQSSEEAFAHWRRHLTQRIEELAAAVSVDQPRLFLRQVEWSRRAFAARDVEESDLRQALASLRETLASELPPAGAGPVTAIVDEAIGLFEEQVSDAEPRLEADTEQGRLALEFLRAIFEGDRRAALDLIVRAVEEGAPIRRIYLDVLLPAQREIGTMWHLGEIDIAEEHFATDTARDAMAILLHSADRAEPNGRVAVCAGVAGNAHDVGIRAVADFFEMAGWRAVNLGGDVPTEDLARAVEVFGADVVALSAAITTQIPAMQLAIDAIRQTPRGSNVKILAGGCAFQETPDIWRKLGADGSGVDAAAAVDEAERLLGDAPSAA